MNGVDPNSIQKQHEQECLIYIRQFLTATPVVGHDQPPSSYLSEQNAIILAGVQAAIKLGKINQPLESTHDTRHHQRAPVALSHQGLTPLSAMVLSGFEFKVIELIQQNANVNQVNGYQHNDELIPTTYPIHIAAMTGNTLILEILLKSGADPFKKDFMGRLAIHQTIYHGHVEAFQLLMQNIRTTKPLKETCQRGFHAMDYALRSESKEMIEAIARFGIKFDLPNDNHQVFAWSYGKHHRQLRKAIYQRQQNAAIILLSKNPKMALMKDSFGEYPLVNAVKFDLKRVVDFILNSTERDMLLKHCDQDCFILHSAAVTGNTWMMSRLLSVGCNVNNVNKFKETALHLASQSASCRCVDLLLAFGADYRARDFMGRGVVHHALRSKSLEMLEYWKKRIYSQDFMRVDNWGVSPLMLAVCLGQSQLWDVLLITTEQLQARDIFGRSLAHFAVFSDDSTSLQKILKKNKSLIRDSDFLGRSLLHYIFQFSAKKCYSFFMRETSGVFIFHEDNAGLIPIFLGISFGNYDLVYRLCNIEDCYRHSANDGSNPLDYLREHQYLYTPYQFKSLFNKLFKPSCGLVRHLEAIAFNEEVLMKLQANGSAHSMSRKR